MHRRHFLTAAAAIGAVALAGCSDDAPDAPPQPPAERLAAVKARFDAARSVTLNLTSDGVPPKVSGVTGAKGAGVIDATEPKFQGSLNATIGGVAGSVEMVAIAEEAWMKFFTPDYNPVDLDTLGAPNPAGLFDSDTGLSTMLTATQNPKAGGKAREGADVIQTFTGTIPGSKVKDLLHLGDGTSSFAVTYGITDQDELRKAVLTGPFYQGGDATYTLVFRDYGRTVEIARP